MKRKLVILLLLLVVSSCTTKVTEHVTLPKLVKSDTLALSILYSHIPKWEGNTITNNPNDRGGLTNSGLTYTTYMHLKDRLDLPRFHLLKEDDIKKCIRWFYYTYNCDKINNAKLAVLFTEFYWSGNVFIRSIASDLNQVLNDVNTGYSLSNSFIDYINNLSVVEQEELVVYLLNKRELYFIDLTILYPSQSEFKQGWLNRNKDLQDTMSNIIYHQVKEGDTLYKIHRLYNVNLNDLKLYNNIQENNVILNSIIYVVKA